MIKELTSFPKRARTIDWEDGKLIFDGDKVMLMPELSVEVMQQIGAYPALVGFHVKHYPLTDEQVQPLAQPVHQIQIRIKEARIIQRQIGCSDRNTPIESSGIGFHVFVDNLKQSSHGTRVM